MSAAFRARELGLETANLTFLICRELCAKAPKGTSERTRMNRLRIVVCFVRNSREGGAGTAGDRLIPGRSSPERVNRDQQLHQIVIGRERGRLQQKDILAADVLEDFDEDLHIGEALNVGTGQREIELLYSWLECLLEFRNAIYKPRDIFRPLVVIGGFSTRSSISGPSPPASKDTMRITLPSSNSPPPKSGCGFISR